MEDAFQKLLRNILLKDYPMYSDVHVVRESNPFRGFEGYEVFLVILFDEWEKIKDTDTFVKIRDLIHTLSKYLQIRVVGVYNEVVDDEEWREMTSNQNDSL